MKVFFGVVGLCLIGVAYSQIIRPGSSPEESGAPIYEEITVESVLTVRSKSGSRQGKASPGLSKQEGNSSETIDSVSRRMRSTALSEHSSDGIISIIPVAASDAVSMHRDTRAIHPKISFLLR